MEQPTSNRRLVTLGVMLGIFLAGIDGTIVTTAMPTIVKSIGGLALYSWVFAIYMLFAAISMPLFGRLSDIYGRKRFFFVGVTVFVLGSALAGASQTMPQLIAFRAVQGIGAGAMYAIPYTILGVIYPPDERGKAIGYGSAVWGVSSVVGPLLGFLIVSTLNWRWVFYISVPVGIGAVVLISISLEETTGDVEQRVDYSGALVLAIGVCALILMFEVLASPAIAALLLVVSIASILAFVHIERSAHVPILPLSLFDDPVFVVTNAVGFLSSFVIFAALTYVPLFVQSVYGGAASAALAVFPISIGWSGTSFVSGRLVNRFGERRLIVTGSLVMTVSFVGASFWTSTIPLAIIFVNVLVLGIGMGMITPPLLTTIQNRLGTEQMGLATSSQQFFRNLGGTIGVAALGLVMTFVMSDQFDTIPGVSSLGDLQRTLLKSSSPPAGLASALTEGLTTAFAVSFVICLLAVGLSVYLPESSSQAKSVPAGDD
jgi:EmrB/QacA subfamily drug resistance transporter